MKKLDWLMEEIVKIKRTLKGEKKEEVQLRAGPSQKRQKQKGINLDRNGNENPINDTARPKPTTNQGAGNKAKASWSQVVGRKTGKTPEGTGAGPTQSTQQGSSSVKQQQNRRAGTTPKKRKLPRTAAITISCPPGLYEETMREAKEKIQLADCGIKGGLNFKRALTGALTLELPGPEGNVRADNLADKMRKLFANKEGVRITRPVKMAEMRVRDLDDSIRPDELKYVVTQTGGCHESEVRVGPIRRNVDGLGIAWIKCPLSAANKIMERGRLQIGWANARIQMLETRPLQCFRCLEGGHVKDQCNSKVNRSGKCYRCGEEGHKAQTCLAPPPSAQCAVT